MLFFFSQKPLSSSCYVLLAPCLLLGSLFLYLIVCMHQTIRLVNFCFSLGKLSLRVSVLFSLSENCFIYASSGVCTITCFCHEVSMTKAHVIPLSCMLSSACTSTHGNTPWRWAWCNSHRVVQCTLPACIHVNRTLLYQNVGIKCTFILILHFNVAFCSVLFFSSQKPSLFLSPHATCTVLATWFLVILCVHQTVRLGKFCFSLGKLSLRVSVPKWKLFNLC